MVKEAFSFALLTVGILSLMVGIWSITLIGAISKPQTVFWNGVLFAALTGAGGISIGTAIANMCSKREQKKVRFFP